MAKESANMDADERQTDYAVTDLFPLSIVKGNGHSGGIEMADNGQTQGAL